MTENYVFGSRYKKVSLYSRKSFWLVIFLGVILAFFLSAKAFIFFPLMIVHILFSWARNRMNLGWLGVEFILFNTVLAGMLLGPVGGLIIASLSVVINYLFSKKYTSYFIVTLPIYALIGLVASFMSIESLVIVGIFAAIAYNTLSFMFSLTMGARSFGLVVFTLTNVAFNILLFSRLGPYMVQLLA